MIRDIQFRAWDIESKYMLEWDDLADPNNDLLLKSALGAPGALLVPMQYTGLKDKNGVEIYEGDIINRYGGGLLGSPERVISSGPVTYKTTSFGIDDPKWGHSNMFNSSELEVIGNIYENKDLLSGN